MPAFIKKYYFLFLLSIIFLFLRLTHLEASLNFSGDQGMHLLDIWNIYQAKTLTLIDAPSSFTVYGRNFYAGPAPYYLLMPILLLTKWNPLSISYLLIFFQLIIVIDLYFLIAKVFKNKINANYFLLFSTFSQTLINYSRFLWNPNFLIPIGGLVLGILMYLSLKEKRNNTSFSIDVFRYIVLGLILGLGLQFHYSFLLAILLAVIWLSVIRQLNLLRLLLLTIGFMVGFFPIIFFELRHNFYNLQTLMLFLTTRSNSFAQTFIPPIYYLFPIVLFIFLGISWFLTRLGGKYKILTIIIFVIFIFNSLVKELPVPKQGFIMVDGWNYSGVKKVEQIILQEGKDDYNIVDILTGDSRALSMRFLLTRDGNPPMGVVEYPSAQALFVYSKVPVDIILKGEMWEVGSASPLKLTKQWEIQNGINLYLLEKSHEDAKRADFSVRSNELQLV